MTNLFIGLLIGVIVGIAFTALIKKTKGEEITCYVYTGYQPKEDSKNSIPPSTGSVVKKCATCKDEDTNKCHTCRDPHQKDKPMAAGIKDAISFFKSENETFDNMLGEDAKLAFEYQVNELALKALKSELQFRTFLKSWNMT